MLACFSPPCFSTCCSAAPTNVSSVALSETSPTHATNRTGKYQPRHPGGAGTTPRTVSPLRHLISPAPSHLVSYLCTLRKGRAACPSKCAWFPPHPLPGLRAAPAGSCGAKWVCQAVNSLCCPRGMVQTSMIMLPGVCGGWKDFGAACFASTKSREAMPGWPACLSSRTLQSDLIPLFALSRVLAGREVCCLLAAQAGLLQARLLRHRRCCRRNSTPGSRCRAMTPLESCLNLALNTVPYLSTGLCPLFVLTACSSFPLLRGSLQPLQAQRLGSLSCSQRGNMGGDMGTGQTQNWVAVLSAAVPEVRSAASLSLPQRNLSLPFLHRPKSDLTPASDKYQSQIQGHHWESDLLHQVAKDT